MEGTLTISRVHNSKTGEFMAIRVTDSVSGVQLLDLAVSMEAFALAVTGMGSQPCTYEVRGIEFLGKHRETKKVRVGFRFKDGASRQETARAKRDILSGYEVDGWHGRDADLGNPHCGGTADGYLVTFTRYVDVPTPEGVEHEND